MTLNLYDHAGTFMEDEGQFGVMLRERKPFLSAIRAALGDEARMRGVRVAFHPGSSRTKRVRPCADYGELAGDGYPMMLALESAGIATGYEASTVVASAGQTLRSLTDEEMEELLRGGLLLDATAAGVLCDREYSAQIGLERVDRPVGREEFGFVISAERFANAEFGGRPHDHLTATLPSLSGDALFARLYPAAGTRIVSAWVNPDVEAVMPAMLACENRFGGRVVMHGLDYASAVGAPATTIRCGARSSSTSCATSRRAGPTSSSDPTEPSRSHDAPIRPATPS